MTASRAFCRSYIAQRTSAFHPLATDGNRKDRPVAEAQLAGGSDRSWSEADVSLAQVDHIAVSLLVMWRRWQK